MSLETSYGNQNTQDVSLAASGGIGRWESTFAGEAFHTDGYTLVPQADQGSVDTNAYRSTALPTLRSRARSARIAKFSDVGGISTNRATTERSGRRTASGSARELWARIWNRLLRFAPVALLRRISRPIIRVSFRRAGPEQPTPHGFADRSSSRDRRIGRMDAQLGKRQTLVAGYDDHWRTWPQQRADFFVDHGKQPKDTATGGHQRTTGVFGEDIIQIAPGWTLAVSARFDDWRNFDAFLRVDPIHSSGNRPLTSLRRPHLQGVQSDGQVWSTR